MDVYGQFTNRLKTESKSCRPLWKNGVYFVFYMIILQVNRDFALIFMMVAHEFGDRRTNDLTVLYSWTWPIRRRLVWFGVALAMTFSSETDLWPVYHDDILLLYWPHAGAIGDGSILVGDNARSHRTRSLMSNFNKKKWKEWTTQQSFRTLIRQNIHGISFNVGIEVTKIGQIPCNRWQM